MPVGKRPSTAGASPAARRRGGGTPVARLLLVPVVALSACSAPATAPDAEYAPPTAEASVPVIQPGLPGEAARTVAPEDAAPPTDGRRWTRADADFVQQMVTHHRQAVEMSALAEDRAGDPEVASIAQRIGLGQAPEVDVMVAWLERRDLEVPAERSWLTGRGAVGATADGGHGAHGGLSAPAGHGMASQAQVRQLADAEGEAFDALFVDLMVRHHDGALAMVDAHAADGVDVQVREMADEMTAVQLAEIRHLEALRPA